MTKTTVVIADDHPVFRIGLTHIIEKSDDFKVIGEAEDSDQLFEILKKNTCNIILLDIKMSGRYDGLKALKVIKESYPETKVLIISDYCNKNIFNEALSLSVDGYITKNDISDFLLVFLKSILRGDKAFSPRIQSLVMDTHNVVVEKLTDREEEVLSLSARGVAREKIADRLNISIFTVNFHMKNIKEKLCADSFAEMISIAFETGLV